MYVLELFAPRQEHTHSLRNTKLLNIQHTRTVGFGNHSIQFERARVWKHLPNHLRCLENLKSFKKLLKAKCCICLTSPSLAMGCEPGKHHDVRAH